MSFKNCENKCEWRYCLYILFDETSMEIQNFIEAFLKKLGRVGWVWGMVEYILM